MINLDIDYPTLYHKQYIETLYSYCVQKKLSLILKGSLAKETAKKFSDIDVIVMGKLTGLSIDEIITIYGKPLMTNFTERPKGILVLNYDNISVDLDLRQTVTQEDLHEGKILLQCAPSFCISAEVVRQEVNSLYMPKRPEWYKTLRLIHRALIKFLVGNTDSANDLLIEIKDSLKLININKLKLTDNFKNDISIIIESI